ncbi:MAG TPA: 50S ribosomal protein L4 [Balneolaceae bacterium]|nr:50S ribosomal protein L4 [Balneolaceae bacterium]
MKLPIFTTEGKDSGDKAELADSIFSVEPNETAIYEDVRRYMANQRQGTANTKERGQVRGGGRKAYRQKGTGQARRGTIRSPLLKGGGTVFGPSPRDYSYSMPKKYRRLARKSALTIKASEDAIKVIEDISIDEPKTKKVVAILEGLEVQDSKVLILTAETDKILYKSARNIPGVEVLEANKPTTYQVLNADVILIQKSAIEKLEGSIEPVKEVVA